MDDSTLKIIKKEDPEIVRCLLVDLCQMDPRNEERIELLYSKYR